MPIIGTQLQAIMPRCPAGQLDIYAVAVSSAMDEGDISTIQRQACFLSNIAEESNQLQEWTENASYSAQNLMAFWPRLFPNQTIANQYSHRPEQICNRAYGNRMGNGPESSGDGWKFRGRCPLQLTGHNNYLAAGTALGVDLVNNPDLALDPETGFRICVWFWTTRNINALADAGDFVGVVKAINGGTNGLAQREAFYNTALSVLQQP